MFIAVAAQQTCAFDRVLKKNSIGPENFHKECT